MSEVAGYDPSERIYFLRKAGFSFTDIVGQMNHEYTYADVVGRFRNFQVRMAADFSLDERTSLTQLELARLDALQIHPYMRAIETGDPRDIDAVLKIMNARSKLLGLDLPNPQDQKQVANILVVGGSQQDFIDALNAGRKGLAGPGSDDDGDEMEIS